MTIFFFFFVWYIQPLRYVFRFFFSSVAGVFFSPCASVLSRDSDFKIGGSAVFVPKNFSALLTRDIGNKHMAPQAKKKLVQCKNLAFYSTVSHIESFFAEQKRKNGAAGKKKLRYSLDGAVSNPVPHGISWFNHGFFFFFFFFFLKIFRLLLRRNRTLYSSGAPGYITGSPLGFPILKMFC